MTDAQQTRAPDANDGTHRGPSWVRAWLGDSSMMLVAQVLTVLATSIAAISVARILEPGDWAVFSAFLGLSLALAIVADFGLATWLLREFSRLAASSAADPATIHHQLPPSPRQVERPE